MKNRFINIMVCALAVAGATSCEDFLTKEPINKFGADTYFSAGETDLKMFTDGMIESWLPDNTDIAISSDANTDLVATKTSGDFYHPGIWNSSKQTGWGSSNWEFLRRCNYMLTNMTKAKGACSDAVYNHYEGVARFWRAYHYMGKVRTFSNVPWTDKYIQPGDSAILYGKRDDREYVFHQILEDLEFASNNCLATGAYVTPGRIYINKWVALGYLSKFALYEASFREHIPFNPATHEAWKNNYETVSDLYTIARDAAKAIIDGGVFSLHSNYSELFISPSLCTDEVIWGKSYSSELGKKHDLTFYFSSQTYGQQYSPTKDLVRMYLRSNGTPVDSGEVPPYEEFQDRDPRLTATVLADNHMITSLAGSQVQMAPHWTWCKTGYMFVKWSIPEEQAWSSSNSYNSMPILRYAEILLNYAEAQCWLSGGALTDAEWNLTIGALRKRAGLTNTAKPATADTWLANYYKEGLERPAELTIDQLEIRRERVTELIMENSTRHHDLYRYGQADLIARRYNNQGWPGIWVSSADAASFEWCGTTYNLAMGGELTDTSYPISNSGGDLTWSLSEGDHGYLIYNYKLEFTDRMYVRPLPDACLIDNPNLGQNYGWGE